MLLYTSSSRNNTNPIKKTISNRPISPRPSRFFHSNNSTKKFHFFDSILSRLNNKSSQLPEQAHCLYDYNAIKQDEICVHRGEYVHIITFDQDNRWFVRRISSMIQGWLPGFVLGLKYPNISTISIPTSSLSSNNLNHL